MRMAVYVGASTVLAGGVILKAFNERPNFYSASVYLAQSNACRMVLLNQLLMTAAGCVYGLQRLLYGRLRPIEIEQLWDKSWYAITETALAMTTFRDEVGGWFFIMFMSLLAGKVWGWIGEGRVEILEQQPPANPRWFHMRLMTSLVLSEVADLLMLRYCIRTLLEQPRPGMMVMFAFEFAILAITSTSTAARYCLSLQEIMIVRRQTNERIEDLKAIIQSEREEARLVSAAQGHELDYDVNAPIEVDESEIDVPGWQEKGRWILFLDLVTDFCKLLVYFGFFTILLVFHSIPIHIIRDVFITSRSFVKRISDFIKYRNATRDMNAKYPDATAEDLARDCTCIICREEMRPWQAPNVPPEAAPGAQRAVRTSMDERQRPKKLPCGHILHFGCLRSWLERQQVCPTCRASVLAPAQPRSGLNQAAPGPGQPVLPADGPQGQPHLPDGIGQAPNGANLRARTFALGPLRLTLAAGQGRPVQDLLRQAVNNPQQRAVDARIVDAMGGNQPPGTHGEGLAISEHLDIIQRRIMREINTLNYAQDQLASVRALQGEFARLRIGQSNAAQVPLDQEPIPAPEVTQASFPTANAGHAGFASGMNARTWSSQAPPPMQEQGPVFATGVSQQHVLGADGQAQRLMAGDAYLPAGMTLPEGWSVLPLTRIGPELSGGDSLQPPDGFDGVSVLAQGRPLSSTSNPSAGNLNVSSRLSAQASSSRDGSQANELTTATFVSNNTPSNSGTDGRNAVIRGLDAPVDSNSEMPDLPNWSNSTPSSTQTSRSSAPGVQADYRPAQDSHSTVTSSRAAESMDGKDESTSDAKGKGRAATVEDHPED